ncbi:N-acetyl-gamma-glutamyl-phosphate reductase [Chryseomicrobium excrementi]|uniref:N-acetyl-gamma-glutamyl-phosphate reductase n=1 Tax=Chryseomicrobium excrementi TaxID=2041346 RepID=A0A2M9F096_9BACL|nr:N-acetyl-gamma-glutamyl-phosphate reductase [Chryseomicrobium excrementi]PJK16875.1 N-acetyl-gamma-glutamyl-phosphate reductase [Chryseomicrobium excrementi]
MKIGIIGATGYGGLELIRLLTNHPHVDEIHVFSSSGENIQISHKYTHLTNILEQPLQAIETGALSKLDVVFTGTPAGVASTILPKLLGTGPKLIDLSGDFRIQDPSIYEQWYGKPAAPQDAVQQAIYGLPEWNRQQIEQAELIANPGCYPTATLLSLLPLLKENLIDASQLYTDAKSGVSGAGNKPSQLTHYSELNENFSIYKINQHQHIPEIEQTIRTIAGSEPLLSFNTHLVPMTRGIMATSYAPLTKGTTEKHLTEALHVAYDNEPFVRVFEDKQVFSTKQVYGSNYCDIQIAVDPRTNRATIIGVIDNLMKGAAGQAVQNMNLMCGLDEKAGLTVVPLMI